MLPSAAWHEYKIGAACSRCPAGAGIFRQPERSAGTQSVSGSGGMQHTVVQDAARQGLLQCMSPVLLQCNVSGSDTIGTACG